MRAVVLCAVVVSVATACSGGGDDPVIDRIDGPAVVEGDQDGVRDG